MFSVLLVDDEEMVLQILAEVLANDGFNVQTAGSAAQATAILGEENVFDIVMTDLKMESPHAGFEVVKAATQVRPRPMIVVLTAFPVPASDWRDAGADALFVKGANTLELPKQLRSLLKGHTSVKDHTPAANARIDRE
jgi:CheY-like chemotaxis protein